MFIRLCPFILVCFFTISSIFNGDVKGFVYLAGLLLNVGITIGIISNSIPNYKPTDTAQNMICDITSFGNKSLSVGENIIGFTFFYLLTTMLIIGSKNEIDLVASNWPTIVFFTLLIGSEIFINTNLVRVAPYCYHWKNSLLTYFIGGIFGAGWAWAVVSTNTAELQYFNQYKNNEKCEKTNKAKFRCKVYKDGVEINNYLQ
jgi:hypothetical protein